MVGGEKHFPWVCSPERSGAVVWPIYVKGIDPVSSRLHDSNRETVYNHRYNHFLQSSVTFNTSKHPRRIMSPSTSEKSVLKCTVEGCKREEELSRHADLERHVKEVHGAKIKCEYPDCTWPGAKRVSRYHAHLKDKHGVAPGTSSCSCQLSPEN